MGQVGWGLLKKPRPPPVDPAPSRVASRGLGLGGSSHLRQGQEVPVGSRWSRSDITEQRWEQAEMGVTR